MKDGGYIGAVTALYETDIAMANTWELIKMLVLVAVGFMVVVVPLSFLFSNTLSRPLVQLSNVLELIESTGELSHRVDVNSRDEIGQTATAFNTLMDAFQSILERVTSVMNAVAGGDLSQAVMGQFKGIWMRYK